MAEIFPTLGLWVWWILAGLMLIIELLLAGIFFIRRGFAAAIRGLFDFLPPPLDWQVEIAIFAVLSAVLVWSPAVPGSSAARPSRATAPTSTGASTTRSASPMC